MYTAGIGPRFVRALSENRKPPVEFNELRGSFFVLFGRVIVIAVNVVNYSSKIVVPVTLLERHGRIRPTPIRIHGIPR